MTQYDPPPPIADFNYIWQKWINGLYAKIVSKLTDHASTTGITASATSIQGGSPLTTDYNEISVCATIGDSVTLPSAKNGLVITIINNGATSADVFPATGDNLGAGLNFAVALASGATITYFAYSATNWKPI